MEELEQDVARYVASRPIVRTAGRDSAGGRRKQGSVHSVLDQEAPGPVCPLLRKKRRISLRE
eukprot:5981330-Amphidinium_carterae.1